MRTLGEHLEAYASAPRKPSPGLNGAGDWDRIGGLAASIGPTKTPPPVVTNEGAFLVLFISAEGVDR